MTPPPAWLQNSCASMVLTLCGCCVCHRTAAKAMQVRRRGHATPVLRRAVCVPSCPNKPLAMCAVKSGMLCARGQKLLMMDADGATKVSDLERLEVKLAEISSECNNRRLASHHYASCNTRSCSAQPRSLIALFVLLQLTRSTQSGHQAKPALTAGLCSIVPGGWAWRWAAERTCRCGAACW